MTSINKHIEPPFSELHNQHNMADFLNYLTSELTVLELNIWMPIDTIEEDLNIYNNILKSESIILGRVSHQLIMEYAPDILERFNKLLEGIKISNPDTQKRSSQLRQLLAITNQQRAATHQFNPLRFLSHVKIFAVTPNFRKEVELRHFHLTQLDWDNLKKDYLYRFYVWDEFHRLLNHELIEIEHAAFPQKAYTWTGKSIELTEVALALFLSGKLHFEKFKQQTDFIKDFLAWFDLPVSNISHDIHNIQERKRKDKFLEQIAFGLVNQNGHPKGKKSKKD